MYRRTLIYISRRISDRVHKTSLIFLITCGKRPAPHQIHLVLLRHRKEETWCSLPYLPTFWYGERGWWGERSTRDHVDGALTACHLVDKFVMSVFEREHGLSPITCFGGCLRQILCLNLSQFSHRLSVNLLYIMSPSVLAFIAFPLCIILISVARGTF